MLVLEVVGKMVQVLLPEPEMPLVRIEQEESA